MREAATWECSVDIGTQARDPSRPARQAPLTLSPHQLRLGLSACRLGLCVGRKARQGLWMCRSGEENEVRERVREEVSETPELPGAVLLGPRSYVLSLD